MTGGALRWAMRGLVLLVALVMIVMTARGVGVRWDPLGLDRRREAAREATLQRTASEVRARRLETQAERSQAERRLDARTRTLAADAAVARLEDQLKEEDHASLDPVRLDRLRDVDRRLCDLAPELDGCSAPP